MQTFRKKTTIQAEQYFGQGIEGITPICNLDTDEVLGGYIETLEGIMSFKIGDWVAIGAKGEKYPIDKAIFELTYELVID